MLESFPEVSSLFESFARLRILVVGDLMLDEYLWGRVERLSPEAPVPVVEVERTSYYPGGAANVARNVLEFTPFVVVAGVVGEDAAGQLVRKLLADAGADVSGVFALSDRPTTQKTRVIGRKQQVVRVDRESREPLPATIAGKMREFLALRLGEVDAVILEDYGKGMFTQEMADAILLACQRQKKLSVVDPCLSHAVQWVGARVVKPNRKEVLLHAKEPQREGERASLERAARLLRKSWNVWCVVVTLGEEGMLVVEPDGEHWICGIRREVFDVTGAGDTAVALLTLGLAAGLSPRQAAVIANCGASVVVGKLGTATVGREELAKALLESAPGQR